MILVDYAQESKKTIDFGILNIDMSKLLVI